MGIGKNCGNFEFNKTTGEIWKDIASNHLNRMTLVNGKNPSDIYYLRRSTSKK